MIFRRRRSGFTLVELLIVIAIVGVLAAIGAGVARKMIDRGRIVASMANLRDLATANAGYVAENGVYCPASDKWDNRRWHGARPSAAARFDPAKGFLAPFLGKSREVGIDPLFGALAGGGESFEEGTGGYGYNSSYIGGHPGQTFDQVTGMGVPERPANVPDPARTVMFTTTAYARAGGVQEYASCEPPFWDFGDGPSGQRPSPSVHFRADGKALVAWCDGHVSAEPESGSSSEINPHGGSAGKWRLGWFGPEDNNGWWNPRRDSQ
jgi:prepilin-type N-terminal cleavage/methylation domain-containing protein/prepilin-type processing-associated H-X9-DG protein